MGVTQQAPQPAHGAPWPSRTVPVPAADPLQHHERDRDPGPTRTNSPCCSDAHPGRGSAIGAAQPMTPSVASPHHRRRRQARLSRTRRPWARQALSWGTESSMYRSTTRIPTALPHFIGVPICGESCRGHRAGSSPAGGTAQVRVPPGAPRRFESRRGGGCSGTNAERA
jgi:hypothetical protein